MDLSGHVVRVGASNELGGLLFVYCEGCADSQTETGCRHLVEIADVDLVHDPTPAELWRVEQRHLSEIAAATRPTPAEPVVAE